MMTTKIFAQIALIVLACGYGDSATWFEEKNRGGFKYNRQVKRAEATNSNPAQSDTSPDTTTPPLRPGIADMTCFPWEVISSHRNGDWCYGTMYSDECTIIEWHATCEKGNMVSPPTSTLGAEPQPPSTTIPTGTTCTPWVDITNERSDNWCYGTFYDDDCNVVHWNGFCDTSTTTPHLASFPPLGSGVDFSDTPTPTTLPPATNKVFSSLSTKGSQTATKDFSSTTPQSAKTTTPFRRHLKQVRQKTRRNGKLHQLIRELATRIKDKRNQRLRLNNV